MANVKVYALQVHAPNHWAVERAANGGRQVRAVAAVTSKRAFVEALAAVGCANVSLYYLDQSGGITGNAAEIEAAMSEPGAVFHETSAAGHGAFVKAAPR